MLLHMLPSNLTCCAVEATPAEDDTSAWWLHCAALAVLCLANKVANAAPAAVQDFALDRVARFVQPALIPDVLRFAVNQLHARSAAALVKHLSTPPQEVLSTAA